MAIQPSARLAGSSHILRFIGSIIDGAAGENGTTGGQAAVANTPIMVRFALADMTDLADQSTRLPASIFDDTQPAAASPHTNLVDGGPTVATSKTWMQNVKVRAQEAAASTAAPSVARFDVLNPTCWIDGLAGQGLGLGTGTPVVGIPISFTAAGVALVNGAGVGVPVIIEIEIPVASIR